MDKWFRRPGHLEILNFKHVVFSGNALYQELRSSHAITDEPCVDLVRPFWDTRCDAIWNLEFPQLVRDLVRLRLYAVPQWYQEEVYTAPYMGAILQLCI